MRIIKDNVAEDNKQYAVDILNKLRMGNRVFGSPAQGLKKTLMQLTENAPKKDSFDSLEYNLNDREYEDKVAKLKKGIKGEEQLGEYFEKILRLDRELSDMIVFASLGEIKENLDYIPDTDFLCLYGNNILIVDAKNVNTKADIPLFVEGKGIYSAINHNDPLIEVNSSIPVWKRIFSNEYNGEIESINGCTCIINKTGSSIFKNEAWVNSDIKPVHIAELVDFLHMWIEDKEPVYDINLLVTIAKQQIQESEQTLDLTYAKRVFGV